MSVLIKGMEMPVGCAFCPIRSHRFCYAAKAYVEETSVIRRHERCPLIELPAQHGVWISVTERLPESVCKSYLCLTDTGYHCEVRWTNNVYGLWKSDNKWGWSIADVPQYCKVTHWMPLPKPPKEVNE